MSKIVFKTEKASDGYIYNDGNYEVEIMGIEYGNSKGSGLAHYAFKLRGNYGEGTPPTFTHFVRDNQWGYRDLYSLAVACGLDPNSELDTEDFIGKFIGITLEETDPYNDKRQWRVTKIFSVSEEDDDDEDGSSVSDDVNADDDEWN
nr:MAG TPA: Protein of unknown function (DUF669) [Caudoviricetes sp.]